MPYIAKHKDTGERIDITLYDNPKATFRRGDCICQLCGQPMSVVIEHLRLGHFVTAHFAHNAACNSDYEAHPESPEHRFGKVYLREQLQAFYSQYGEPDIQLEVPIPMEWRAKGRIADLMVTWRMGWREVHEVQLANITPETLQERTNDYQRSGIDVRWWLGGKADNERNRDWCISVFGESLSIRIDRQNVRVGERDERDVIYF